MKFRKIQLNLKSSRSPEAKKSKIRVHPSEIRIFPLETIDDSQLVDLDLSEIPGFQHFQHLKFLIFCILNLTTDKHFQILQDSEYWNPTLPTFHTKNRPPKKSKKSVCTFSSASSFTFLFLVSDDGLGWTTRGDRDNARGQVYVLPPL